jgi:beta-mannosidase
MSKILSALTSTWPANARQTLLLSGNDWKIKDTLNEGGDVFSIDWVPATVPGNIQADLEASRHLKPLSYGNGDPRLPEVALRDWRYRKTFKVPATFAGKRITLEFDGVDYESEIWLNDQKLGKNSGMFKRFRFDVTHVIRPELANLLEVRIAGMPKEFHDVFPTADAPGGINVGIVNIALQKQLRGLKSPTNCAWDWAFAVYTLGIWKDVRLVATDSVRIDNVGVLSYLGNNHTKADLRILVDVDSLEPMPLKITITATCHDSKISTTIDSQVIKGENQLDIPISLDDPLLWWPIGHGEQPLYELRVEISRPESGNVMDARSTRFGVREISWEQVPGAPADFINPMKLVVNGRPIRQMGSNLIPADIFFGRMDERFPRLLEMAPHAGLNCLRVWGGGVILSEAIYDRADELGIMLMQEFPLANQWPETDTVFLSTLRTTAVDIVKQVRNHPSIIEWSGGNEMLWRQGTDNPALHVLEDVVKEHDNRFLRATEPAQGSGPHGTYTYVYHTKPASYLTWLGAGEENLYQRYNTSQEMRLSEFGTNSPANLEVWHRTIPPNSQWPLSDDDPILIRKNVFGGAALKENWLHKEITEDIFGPLDGLEQLVRAGQFLGAEGLRYAMDALRRKGEALGGGFMSWDYNEPWPNGAGSYMIDYDGRPLMNYYLAKQALSPVGLNLKYDSLLFDPSVGVKAELFLVSDAPATIRDVKWRWLARDCRGRVIASEEGTNSIDPIEVKPLGTVNFPTLPDLTLGPLFIELQLFGSNKSIITERIHVFGPDGVPAPLAGLLRNQADQKVDSTEQWMPVSRTALQVESMPVRTEGDYERLDLIVSNPGSMTALFCEPHPVASYRTDTVIGNNFCFIPPGESRSITIRSLKDQDGGLSLSQVGWKVTAWNADPVTVEPSPDLLLLLGRQDGMCREFAGYPGLAPCIEDKLIHAEGRQPNSANIPYLMDADMTVEFQFNGLASIPSSKARLRIHTSDQAPTGTAVLIDLNGQHFELPFAPGYGLQAGEPPQLAQPKTIEITIENGIMKEQSNRLKINVTGGWFTWDALDLTSLDPED